MNSSRKNVGRMLLMLLFCLSFSMSAFAEQGRETAGQASEATGGSLESPGQSQEIVESELEEAYRELVFYTLMRDVEYAGVATEIFVTQTVTVMRSIADRPDIVEFLAQPEPSRELTKHMDAKLEVLSGLLDIGRIELLGKNGVTAASSVSSSAGNSHEQEEYFRKVIAGASYFAAPPRLSKITQAPVFICTVPVRAGGSVVGVVKCNILLGDFFRKAVPWGGCWRTDVFFAFNDARNLVYHQDVQQITSGNPLDRAVFENIAGQNLGIFVLDADNERRKRIFSYYRVEALSITLARQVDFDEALGVAVTPAPEGRGTDASSR